MLQVQDVEALRGIREQFEQSTPAPEWPAAAAAPMMLLADVCAALGLGAEGTRQVLGDPAAAYLAELTGAPGLSAGTGEGGGL